MKRLMFIPILFVVYREFIWHPEFRGPNFSWSVPWGLAVAQWRVL